MVAHASRLRVMVVGQPSPVDITKFRPAHLDMGKRGWVSDAAGMVVKNELILLQMGLIIKGIRNCHDDKRGRLSYHHQPKCKNKLPGRSTVPG